MATSKSVGEQITSSLTYNLHSNRPLKITNYPRLNGDDNFTKTLNDAKRVPCDRLRNFASCIPVRHAISRVYNGVASMPWDIEIPKEIAKKGVEAETDASEAKAAKIRRSLMRPNRTLQFNTYKKVLRATIEDILVLGVSIIERQQATPMTQNKEQHFWLYPVNPELLVYNNEWSPEFEGARPVFWDRGWGQKPPHEWRPIFRENIFFINAEANTYEFVPKSPVEIAYVLISSFLETEGYKRALIAQACRQKMITLPDSTPEEVRDFRNYWNQIILTGEIPIVGGQVEVRDIGASNDDELYPKYTEYLLRMLALAFNLGARDMNILEPDNRATAGVAADIAFANAILPMSEILAEHFNIEVIDYYHEGYSFKYADLEPRGELEESQIAKDLFAGMVITRNEARAKVGEENLGVAGDRFMDGTAKDDDPKQVAEEKAEQQQAMFTQNQKPPNPNAPDGKKQEKEEKNNQDKQEKPVKAQNSDSFPTRIAAIANHLTKKDPNAELVIEQAFDLLKDYPDWQLDLLEQIANSGLRGNKLYDFYQEDCKGNIVDFLSQCDKLKINRY